MHACLYALGSIVIYGQKNCKLIIAISQPYTTMSEKEYHLWGADVFLDVIVMENTIASWVDART